MKLLTAFRVLLVITTAIFMSYHTQIFISHIEQNFTLSWIAALAIEGFLISLALQQKTIITRILLTLLFTISVVSASASFVVQNENLLNSFFKNKRLIEQLRTDIVETQEQLSLSEKYTTKTLQRERALKDELRAILKEQSGDITLLNSLIFLVFVFVMQSVSIYTASSLKNEILLKRHSDFAETKQNKQSVSEVSERETKRETHETHEAETLETNAETTETNAETSFETTKKMYSKSDIIAKLREMKNRETLSSMSEKFNISKATLSRILSAKTDNISDEIFKKIVEKL